MPILQLRWVYHNLNDGPPPAGSLLVGNNLWQKLQYRVTNDGLWVDVLLVTS